MGVLRGSQQLELRTQASPSFRLASCRHWKLLLSGLDCYRAMPNGKVKFKHANLYCPIRQPQIRILSAVATHLVPLALSTFFDTCFFGIALYIVNGQNLFRQSCRLYRHAVFLLQLQECGYGKPHANWSCRSFKLHVLLCSTLPLH